tara:strand:+ start:6276 stop:6497 length:222 start_codon:yes stop_codon:yes gene_type:complete
MTKASIVQRLLEENKITAEEAVVLLKTETVKLPLYTYTHDTITPPIWCSTDTLNTPSTGDSWEYKDTKYTPEK